MNSQANRRILWIAALVLALDQASKLLVLPIPGAEGGPDRD